MVSASMPRCTCRCYDNECILKTNTSRLHIADKPTPNVSRPTSGYCGYRHSAYGHGWWRCSAEPTGARERLMDALARPTGDMGRSSLCFAWFPWPVGAGATWTSCSPAAPRHSLATCNVNVGSDSALHCRRLPSAGSQVWAPVLIRRMAAASLRHGKRVMPTSLRRAASLRQQRSCGSLRGRGSLW